MLRPWRVKLLLGSLSLLLLLYCFKGLYLDSQSSSVERCRGKHCKEFPALDPSLHHNLIRLEAPSLNQHRHLPVPVPPHTSSSVQLSESDMSINTSSSSSWQHSAPPLSPHFQNLTLHQAQQVKKFVFFVGYGRSGHSIVASLMDAHPNVIIAHEFYLFDELPGLFRRRQLNDTRLKLYDRLYYSSYSSARSGWRSSKVTSKGYNLNLNGSWQGQFDRLEVIGDKTGGSTAMLYHDHPEVFKSRLWLLDVVTRVPHVAIHVVRNPYDMIATVAMFQASADVNKYKVEASIHNKFKRIDFIKMAADIVLSKAEAVAKMVGDCKLDLLEIHLEDLIADPSTVIRRICGFLGVSCTEEYVDACKQKLFRKASHSRELVEWPESVQKRIEAAIKQFSFFQRYSFQTR